MFVMVKGHTFTVLDQSFNTMISQLMSVPIYTVASLMEHMFTFLRPYNCISVIELDHLWDWKEFFKPHVHRLGGFATGQFGAGMHEFYARKDSDGIVRLWFRASSQSSSWLPEGPGYQVFETLPIGKPPLAPAKADEAWSRTAVEGTVRAWYQYMTASISQATAIRAGWEQRFRELPPNIVGTDGERCADTNQLLDSKKLQWADLPRRSYTEPSTGAVGGSGVTGRLENPTVNPITGLGRAASDVTQDLARYRREVRAAHQDALFQADYLFVQMPGCNIDLHRVVHGVCIDDATDPDLHFTAGVYDHTPQRGFSGFWGIFELRPNPLYDPKDPRKGTKFVRLKDVRRDAICLYAVETFTTKEKVNGEMQTCLRVKASSLDRLSQVCPHMPMPAKLPGTHVKIESHKRQKQQPDAGPSRTDATGKDTEMVSEEGEAGEDEDDTPAPIPHGFQKAVWLPGQQVKHFMLWTAVGKTKASWHTGVIVKQLGASRRDGFTHDAKLDGTSDMRGVKLTEALHAEGVWILLEDVQ